MDWVRVGQRVKVVAYPERVKEASGPARSPCIGDEGVITGTISNPNQGFRVYADRNISVLMDYLDRSYMAPHWCFEPVVPPHQTCDDAEFIASLDDLAKRVEEVA